MSGVLEGGGVVAVQKVLVFSVHSGFAPPNSVVLHEVHAQVQDRDVSDCARGAVPWEGFGRESEDEFQAGKVRHFLPKQFHSIFI